MFDQIKLRRLSQLSFITVCLTFLVIAVGVFTRLSDAGLGCPDWPGCYGHLIVPQDHATIRHIDSQFPATPLNIEKAQIEMGHRYLAGILGIFILSVALACVRVANTAGFRYVIFATLLFLLLIYQVFLGLWTVTLKLSPFVVMQHLLIGLTILSLLWVIYLSSRFTLITKNSVSTPFRLLSAIGLTILVLQIIMGVWTSAHDVGLLYMGISMMHRWGALLLGGIIFWLFLLIQIQYRSNVHLRKISFYLLIFLCLQSTLGVLNVIFQLPLFIAIAHNLVAAALLLTMVTLNFYLGRK